MTPAIVTLSHGGFELARRIAPHVPGSEIHGLVKRVPQADVTFDAAADHLRALFAAHRPIIAVMAAGIVIRALAPLLSDKRREPPVIAVSDDGASIVPLLGGHSGANQFARDIAHATGGTAAVTTAGDVRLGVALDEPPIGYRLANPQTAKRVTAALLSGQPAEFHIEAGDGLWLKGSRIKQAKGAKLVLRVTDCAAKPRANELVYHPATLALGVGCERNASPKELATLVRRVLKQAKLAPESIAGVFSLDLKSDEAAVLQLADSLGVPARFFTAKRLERETPRLANPSDTVFRAVGCHGVAEAAALAAAGPRGELVVAKTASRRATVAIARAPKIIDMTRAGSTPGRLDVVGLGPGDPAWLTPEAKEALTHASDVVGYGLYLDLAGDLIASARRHEAPLGAEEKRARKALDLASQGKRVALISSGDPGIYALATLVFELIERKPKTAWQRVAVQVMPGISAMQAAAARAGAPLGHDFCAISLSDLLTPWPVIEQRLRGAAAGDFVVALYNPVSARRRDHIVKARDILLGSRAPDTPVLLAHDLGRTAERIEMIPLRALTADHADMTTLVMIGSSTTRKITHGGRERLYTPRGYAAKRRKKS
jgi:cobalt-precorrin 5A hydrolase/precorrin-3B C17-methyltransferase